MSLSIHEAAAELLLRRAARTDLYSFIRYVSPEYIANEFAREACSALDQFIVDVVNGSRPILILQAPPQHGKSDIVSRHLPAYLFGRFPDWNVGGLSYSSDLASDMNRDVQRIMMTDEYRALFPASVLGQKIKGKLDAKQNTEAFEIPGRKGSYRGAGVGGPLTGRKINIGIIDDPIKNAKEALSEVIKDGIHKWYQSTFLTRLAATSGQIIMATAWALDDLSGRVMAENPRAKVLKFKAINEAGEALVPELHPLEQLLEMQAVLSDYFWSAMYQQSPKASGGNIFKDEFVQYYLPKDLPDKFDKSVASWDFTFKDSDGTDYVAGHVWGKKGANSYLLDRVHARMGFTKSKDALIKLHKDWPEARRILVEDKANGPAIIDSLKSSVPGLIAIEPDGSKLARAHAVTAYWEAGNIWLPHPDIAPWVKSFVSELTTFPASAHDDDTDAMTQALRDMYPQRRLSMNINPNLVRKSLRQ